MKKQLAMVLSIILLSSMGAACPDSARDPIPAAKPNGLPDSVARWRKTNLTFFIVNFTTKNTEEKQVQAIADSFNKWGAVTPLNFARTTDKAQADFFVGFGTGGHCELYVNNNLTCPTDAVFDPTTLAHAYFPDGENQGQCHVNDDQDWSDDRLLLSTLVHELGHGLGLEHLPEANAVMFASDNGQTGDLQAPDITAIQRLYGSRDGTVKPEARVKPPSTDANINRTAPTTSLTDTDGDGIDDATELYILGTNPEQADTDGDGLGDGVEAYAGLDAMNEDTDGDGEADGDEADSGTNCYLPDFGLTGDATPFVGKYVGTDSLTTPISFTVAADGSVTGSLSLIQFGFDEDYELIGEVGTSGVVEMVSYDYFFEYKGTIVADAVNNGTFETDLKSTGTWTAAKAAPRLKLPDVGANAFKIKNYAVDGTPVLQPLRRPDIASYYPPRK